MKLNLNKAKKPFKIVGLISLMICGHTVAASDIKFFTAEPDPVELAIFLFNNAENKPQKDTGRSLKIVEKEPAPTGVVPILFEFDSDAIKPQAFTTIETIAQMLNTDQAAGKSLLIEGHTDAVGEKLYNEDLSRRRAISVKNILVKAFDIDPTRLLVVGKGESELYDENTPNAPINRRVQLKRYDNN